MWGVLLGVHDLFPGGDTPKYPRSAAMATPTHKLTDTGVKNAKPGPKPVKLFDGEGLFLLIQPNGGKLWRLKYRFGGKEKLLALGTYPEIKLKDARERRQAARELIAKGIDASETKKAEKASRATQSEGTFEAVAREWHKVIHTVKTSEGHAARTLIRLEQDAFPYIGALPIADITAPKLLEVLRRVESRGAIETAHRIKQACGQVFRYGIATGRCERDPSADLRDALKPVIVKHYAAITDPKAVGGRPFIPAAHPDHHHAVRVRGLAGLVSVSALPWPVRQAVSTWWPLPLPQVQPDQLPEPKRGCDRPHVDRAGQDRNRLGDSLARPQFMRQKTYDRLRERYWALEMAREDAFCEFATRLGLLNAL